MPEIARFSGIVVGIFHREHPPAHFHASCGDDRVRINIVTGQILSGSFPRAAEKLLLGCWKLHRAELLEIWDLAQQRRPLRRIAPLE